MTDDREAQPAPPTTRIYLRLDDPGDKALHNAVTTPPRGSLDGWTALDVDAEVWERFYQARADYNRKSRDAELAAEACVDAANLLREEVNRRG